MASAKTKIDSAFQPRFVAPRIPVGNQSPYAVATDATPVPALSLLADVGLAEWPDLPSNDRHYDLQTGLPNYNSFCKSLSVLLHEWPAGREVALMWIDLFDLRKQFFLGGAATSEALLVRVADILRATVDDTALLGRFSGRCFVVALPAARADRRDRRKVQQIVHAIRSTLLQQAEIEPQIAAGVAYYPSDTRSIDDLVRFAGLAANRAGYLRSASAISFRTSMNNLVMRNYHLEVEMRKGLENNQFSTAYQVKVDLQDGRLLGAEALIRWNHPEWGPVTPAEFIPVAERSALIHRIFDLTLRTALRDAKRWRQAGLPDPVFAVNVSAANLRRSDFVPSLRRTLRELDADSSQLELEVTESVLIDDEELFAMRVRQLKEIGIRIAIDDFGTRYTGFNLLKRVPLDGMKIDKCFLCDIHRSREARVVYQTIVAMAHHLRMRTVAEGIENQAELDVLREIGCEAGQGYLFQRPMEESQFARFLQQWPQQMPAFGFAAPLACSVMSLT